MLALSAPLFSIAAQADTTTPLDISQKLSDRYQYTLATQCTQMVNSGANFDPAALPIVASLVDRSVGSIDQAFLSLEAIRTILENQTH